MPGGVCGLWHVSKLLANVVYVSRGRPDPPDRSPAAWNSSAMPASPSCAQDLGVPPCIGA